MRWMEVCRKQKHITGSGIGAGSIRDFCQSLCPDKPLYRMLLTHYHGDHILNCYQFDCVYMSEDTYRLRADLRNSGT